MNVKKMFAGLAGVLVAVVNVVPMATLGAASYSDELQAAYGYAKANEVTTMSTIDNANMYGQLTRGQLAKMISNWAEKELDKKVDETLTCSFTDANTAEGDLATYVKKSCQMGLMGQGIEKFRPNDVVTRGEFGTTLSRAIWGDKYNTSAVPFYKDHLNALKDAGIMTNISSPDAIEMRGWVMLMLMRAASNLGGLDTNAECKDPMTMLACVLELDTCPAACKKGDTPSTGDVVKAGNLQVSANPATNRKVIIGGVSDLDTITFKADQAINVERVVLERYGYSSADDIVNIWLEDEKGTVITNQRGLSSKDEVSLTINRDYRQMEKSDLFTIVVEVASAASGTKVGTLGFKVKDIVSSAKNLDLSSYTPYQYDMVNYDGTDVALEVKGKDRTYNYTANEKYEVSRLQVKASNAAVLVRGFTMKNDGNLDLGRYVKTVEVLVDNEPVKGLKTEVKRDDVIVSFDNVKIDIRKNATFVVNVVLQDLDRFGDTIKLVLESTADFSAIEEKTQARVSIPTLPTTWKTYTFNGSKIQLTNTKLASTIDGAKGSVDVVIGEGKIEVGEPIILDDFTIITNQTGIDTMKMVVGTEEFDARRTADGTGFVFRNVLIEKNAPILFKVDIHDDATDKALIAVESVFAKSLRGTAPTRVGKYDESGEVIKPENFVGSITLSNVRVQPAKGALDNNLTKEVEFIQAETSRKVVFEGEYTAQKGDIYLNEFALAETTAQDFTGDVTFYLSINGREVGSVDVIGTGADELFTDVLVKKGEKATIKLEANVYGDSVDNYLYTLTLKGEDADGNVAGEASEDTVRMKVVSEGSVIVSDDVSSLPNTVVLRGANNNLAKFVVKANRAGETTLSSIEMKLKDDALTLTGSDLRVKVANQDADFVLSTT